LRAINLAAVTAGIAVINLFLFRKWSRGKRTSWK